MSHAKVVFAISPDPFGNFSSGGLNDIHHGNELSFMAGLIKPRTAWFPHELCHIVYQD